MDIHSNILLFQHFLKDSVQHIYNESFDDPNNNNKKLLKVYTIDDNILGKYDVELYDMFTNDDTNETYVHVPPFSKRAALTEAQAPDWGHLSHLMFYELPGYDKAFWQRLLDHANIHEQRLERRDNDPSTVYGYKIKGCLNPAVDEKLFRSTFK